MESTRWRDVMHAIVHNRHFWCFNQHLELVWTDVWGEERSNTAAIDNQGHFIYE